MLAALLLAGVCGAIPLFDMSGPVCAPSAQLAECQCSECMTWDPIDRATSYQVNRLDPSGSWGVVGTNSDQEGIDEDGLPYVIPASTFWCFARDNQMPREGLTYVYTVAACNVYGCSPWSASVSYTAAPYAIDHFRPPVEGNP